MNQVLVRHPKIGSNIIINGREYLVSKILSDGCMELISAEVNRIDVAPGQCKFTNVFKAESIIGWKLKAL